MQESGEYDIGDRHFYYALTRSEEFQNEPPRKKVVRIETCQSQTLICSDGANGLKCLLTVSNIYYYLISLSFSNCLVLRRSTWELSNSSLDLGC